MRSVGRRLFLAIAALALAGGCTSQHTAVPPAAPVATTTAVTVPTSPAPVATTASSLGAPTPTVVNTPVTQQPSCPADSSVCAFAGRVSQALRTSTSDAIVASLSLKDYECPGPRPRGAGDAFPLCDGAAPGEHRSGHLVARLQSEGEVHGPATYKTLLDNWLRRIVPTASDEVGPGTLRLHTVGCPRAAADPMTCKVHFSVTLSAIVGNQGADARREMLMFFVEQPAGSAGPGVVMTVYGMASSQDPYSTAIRGGTAEVAAPQGFPPFGRFLPWTPVPEQR